ncbi:MAG TPA: pilus assembly protein PilM, partial [Abditibacteriaceae bacterium]
PADDFDLDAITFNQPGQDVPAAVAADPGMATSDVIDDIFSGGDFGSTDFGDTDFGTTDFGGMDDFGAGLVGGDVTSGITGETVYGVLNPLLEDLMGEVRRSLEYFGSRYPDAGVRRITLVGGGARLANIDAYFTQSLGIPTTCGNPFSGITIRALHLSSSEIDDNSPLYAVALGLALRDLV